MQHALWYISLPSMHDYDVKLANFTFYGEREHKTTVSLFFLCTWIQSFRIHILKKWPTFDKLRELEQERWGLKQHKLTMLQRWKSSLRIVSCNITFKLFSLSLSASRCDGWWSKSEERRTLFIHKEKIIIIGTSTFTNKIVLLLATFITLICTRKYWTIIYFATQSNLP